MHRAARRPVVLLALLACLPLGGCGLRIGGDSAGTRSPAPGSTPVPTRPLLAPEGFLQAPPGMATISLAELPPEALDTLALIAAGGPYPYRQDGAVFENRERLLPGRPTGHYREFTVVTPGEDDRGARRIVTGVAGERYWTDDHYDSFRWIVR
jgi:ribonuclease T1